MSFFLSLIYAALKVKSISSHNVCQHKKCIAYVSYIYYDTATSLIQTVEKLLCILPPRSHYILLIADEENYENVSQGIASQHKISLPAV